MLRALIVPAVIVLAAAAAPGWARQLPSMSDAELALLREGVRLHNAGDYDGAIEKYRQALEIDATNAAAYHQIAFAAIVKGDYEHCLEMSEKGIEVAEQPIAELFASAGSCADDLERYDVAAQHFAAGESEFPTNQRLLYNYAVHKVRVEEPEHALRLLARSLDVERHHASSHSVIAITLAHQGQDELAALAALRFLSLEPAGPRTLDMLGVLESLLRRRELDDAKETVARAAPGVEDNAESRTGTDQPLDESAPEEDRDGIEVGQVRVAAPQNEEQEEKLIDMVLSAANAAAALAPDGTPRFPDAERRTDIVTLIEGQSSRVDSASENLEGRYRRFFATMAEAGVTDTFGRYVLQMVSGEELQGWVEAHQQEVAELIAFLRSH